ncbi:MAG: inorganic phosphate transporter [Bacteroidota bacterium]|nr:inorganic phosphate transporter [Bacteroidota bacterium]
MLVLVIICIIIALGFDFLNGMNDAGNSIATIVATGVLKPKTAVIWAAFFNFIAFMIFGVKVATTIGKGIVNNEIVHPDAFFILSALLSSIAWVYFCGKHGLPNSVSHALIGGLIGPALLKAGINGVHLLGVGKIVLFIVLAPVMGFIIGYFFMVITLIVFRRTTQHKVDSFFRIFQLASSAAFSLGHGGNDAQKTMGVIMILILSIKANLISLGIPSWIYTGYFAADSVPLWVVLSAQSAIALGTLTGAWKIIRTLGVKLTHLKPVGGFCAETAGALTLFFATSLGIPVSTTHTITGAIMGVGVTKRVTAVKWGIAGNIITAWILTIPATLIISCLLYWIISHLTVLLHLAI